MKKIISGKVYDTGKATLVASVGQALNNFYETQESLYVTDKGTWFIHGQSTAGGKYGTTQGNNMGGGDNIILLNDEELLEWVGSNCLSDDEVEDIMKRLNLAIG